MTAIATTESSRKSFERRIGMRTTLTVPVLIETMGGPRSARLCSLSEGGAMVESQVPLRPGEQVAVNCGSVKIEGVVVWQEDKCSGIEFDRPLEEGEVARQILRSSAVAHRLQLLASAALG